jgi:hypothetical protein
VSELASAELRPALVASDAGLAITTRPANAAIELVTRRTPTHLYLIAVRASGSVTRVAFSGLPRTVRRGDVLFEHVQEPLPPPVNRRQVPRRVIVTDGSLSDWFAPHDAHVYRFAI